MGFESPQLPNNSEKFYCDIGSIGMEVVSNYLAQKGLTGRVKVDLLQVDQKLVIQLGIKSSIMPFIAIPIETIYERVRSDFPQSAITNKDDLENLKNNYMLGLLRHVVDKLVV